MRRTTLIALALALLGCALPGSAHAATVSVSGEILSVTGGRERNLVTISRLGADVRVVDRSPVRAGPGCRRSGNQTALCPLGSLRSIRGALGSGNDQVAVDVALPASISGGPGNDTFASGPAADRLDGGPGRDTITYAGRRTGISLTLAGGADDGAAGEGDDVVAVEDAVGSPAADALVGASGPNRLSGGAGGDRLDGGGGDDALIGGLGDDAVSGGPGNDVLAALPQPDGADVLAGGPGADRADFAARAAGVVADPDGRPDDGERPPPLGAPAAIPAVATLLSPERDMVMTDVESLRGGTGDDVLAAGFTAGTVEGMDGTDVVSGGRSVDTLAGGAGFDRILARDGRADRIDCGTQVDRVFVDGKDTKPKSCEHASPTFAVGLAPVSRVPTAGGSVALRVTCPAQAARRCVGAVRLVTVRRVRTATGRRRTVTLGAARFNALTGTATDARVVLDETARAVVRRLGGATRVRAVARGRDEAGPARPVAARFVFGR